MMHRIDAAEYQRRFNLFTSQGYAPTVVSATGPGGNAEFAAVFEQRETRPWFARHGMFVSIGLPQLLMLFVLALIVFGVFRMRPR